MDIIYRNINDIRYDRPINNEETDEYIRKVLGC